MAYNAYNNEPKNDNIMTYGGSYNNTDTKEKMSIDYSGRLVTVKIMPVSGDDYKGDEKQGGKIAFSASTAAIFLDELEDAFKAFKQNQPFSSMVQCGVKTNNGIQITDGRNINRPYGMYIVIYVDIQQNRQTKNIHVYTLKSAMVIKDYNAATGNGEAINKPFREIKEIITNFDEFVKSANRAAAHAFRDADKYSRLGMAAKISNAGGGAFKNEGKGGSKSIFENNVDDSYSDYSSALSQVLTDDYYS